MKAMNKHPIAVLISDIHFTVNTLEEAKLSFIRAQSKAVMLNVPLVVAGDTLDSKAIMRAECVNALIQLVSVKDAPPTIFLVGNHDLCNEKGKEHALNFLKPYATVIETPTDGSLLSTPVCFIPYQSDTTVIKKVFDALPEPQIVIMHQGINGSNSGEYIQDRTALNKEDLAGFRVISGHYHQRQSFDLPSGGKFDYIGNPYTLGFGEAYDPEKGYQVLYNDGSLEFVKSCVRKHIIINDNLLTGEYTWSGTPGYYTGDRKDTFWVKITGSSDDLSTFDRNAWAKDRGVPKDFRLDLIHAETTGESVKEEPKDQLELFDLTIDSLNNTSDTRKERLKRLYKDLIS